MPALLRSRLTLLAAVAALAAALPACGTDDAVEKDTQETRQNLDEGLGDADEKAGDAAKEAADNLGDALNDADDADNDVDADDDGR